MSFLTKFRLFKRGAGWLFTGNIGFLEMTPFHNLPPGVQGETRGHISLVVDEVASRLWSDQADHEYFRWSGYTALVGPMCWLNGGEAKGRSRFSTFDLTLCKLAIVGALQSCWCSKLQFWIRGKETSFAAFISCEHVPRETRTIHERCQPLAS